MKKAAILFFIFIVTSTVIFTSCKKESYITSSDAYLRLSEDTLHFDTVFTTLGSTTQFLKVFNQNEQKLRLSSIQLMGGSNSFFKLNVDGDTGTTFTNIDIQGNDSLYFFASVKIDPTIANLPYLVRDSVKIEYNGNVKWLQLEAYGKNARFMRDVVVTKDSSVTSDLPIVVLGSLYVVPNATLIIPKCTQIFVHANAPIVVDGTLKAIGDTGCRVTIQGIRIDEPYKNFPGSWPGIYFRNTSKDNLLKQCVIKNAYQGVIVQGASSIAKLNINECVFDNIYDIAVGGFQSNIAAQNCLFSNVGYGLYTVSGGTYNFNHCTFVSISNSYLAHKNPLINLSNTNDDNSAYADLKVTINNSIIYGEGGFVDDEIAITKIKSGIGFNANFNTVLYKQKSNSTDLNFNTSIANQNPMFANIDLSKRLFDFRLKTGSPCINVATSSTLAYDLDKKSRSIGLADIGCYEK
jgi:hypothetical protein